MINRRFLISIVFSLIVGSSFSQDEINSKLHEFNLTIKYNAPELEDTLYLSVGNLFYNNDDLLLKEPIKENGYCRFKITTGSYRGRLTVFKKRKSTDVFKGSFSDYIPITPTNMYWDASDSLIISITKKADFKSDYVYLGYEYIFEGKGFQKYLLRFKSDSISFDAPCCDFKQAFDSLYKYTDPYSRQIEAGINYLNKNKALVSKYYYDLLKADLISSKSSNRFTFLKDFFNDKIKLKDSLISNRFKRNLFQSLNEAEQCNIPAYILSQSKSYIYYLYEKINFQNLISNGFESHEMNFKTIITNYKGDVKDKLIVQSFLASNNLNKLNESLERALLIINNPECKVALSRLRARTPGFLAYNFKLPDTAGNIIELDDFKGKIVLIDFWFTGCGGCAKLYSKVLKNAEKHFSYDSNIVFISVSIDLGKEYWLKSIKSNVYTSSQSINLYTGGQGKDHPLIRYYGISMYPTVLLVNPEGKIYKYFSSIDNTEFLISEIRNVQTQNQLTFTK
ncbi:TlpA family protein disulfide reductase [Niastella caeni]|uniref:TlpA family protein disulfide reductase n=1 Tax=Niastella caeni TaxID=2569763 RepID=A0A4S8HYG1_9BACT|nr:TlpA disulfide reductase family protein [Niastella caeni]THU40813.1 TlpA family protein disulfide reductase [Niastella caeni]